MTETLHPQLISPDRATDEDKGQTLWSLDSNVLDLLPVAVYFCDAAGTLVRWNRAAVQLWGREPVAGDHGQRFCGSFKLYQADGTHLEHADCPMAATLESGEARHVPEVIMERPDGTRRYVMATMDPIHDANGELIGAVNVLQDVTERKLAEMALSDIEHRFQRLLEKLPAAAYTCDAEGLITFYNERAVELWGREPKLNDPIDRFCGSFRLFTTQGEPIRHDGCWMALALQDRREYEGQEIVIEREDRTRCTALAYATPFFKDSGRLAGAMNVLVDITERNAAQARINELLEKEKEHSERLREADRRKDEFLAMLAHELRNPLAPIRTGLDLLRSGAPRTEETLEVMCGQVDHLVRLVDDLLDVSRIVRGRIELRREPVSMTTVINRSLDAVRPAVEQRDQRLSVSLPDEDLWLDADVVRMVQVVENLLNNASKYTPLGGEIEVGGALEGSDVVISVRDNGVGIDPDLLPSVFELFTQSERSLDRSDGGLGIGLTLVKKLVTMHGGTVMAHSDGSGSGSRFEVRLPLAKNGLQMSPQSKQSAASGKRRILVVDDSVGAAKMLSLLLNHLGPHEVELAHDGPTAIEMTLEFRPDLLLLDIGLPKMNGLSVARALRENEELNDMLLVALTGYGQEEDRQKSKEAGFDEHLVKPVDVDTLRELLAHPKLQQVSST